MLTSDELDKIAKADLLTGVLSVIGLLGFFFICMLWAVYTSNDSMYACCKPRHPWRWTFAYIAFLLLTGLITTGDELRAIYESRNPVPTQPAVERP